LRQHSPGNTAAEHENDAREASTVCQDAVAHRAAWATELAEEVRSNSTTHQERARQLCEGPPRTIECRICYLATREFCYRLLSVSSHGNYSRSNNAAPR
jgi:hypothetical protein